MSKKLRLAASVAIVGVLAWRTDWTQVRQAFAALRFELWLAAVTIYAVTQAVSALRWQLLARPLGFGHSFTRYLRFYYIGMFFNLVLPTSVGGDVVRAWYLDGQSGRRAAAFVSVIADRVSGLLVLLFLALLALPFCPPELPAWLTRGVAVMAGGALLLLGLLLLGSRLIDTRHSLRSTDGPAPRADFSPHSRLQNLHSAVRNLHSAIFPSPPIFLLTTVLSIVVQLANVLIVWLIGLALHLAVPGGYYLMLAPTVALLTLLPISLNGMGVREGSLVIMLAPLGIATGPALTLAFLWFVAFLLPSLGGAFCYWWGGVDRFKEKAHGESLGDYPDQGRARQSRPAA